ncbi:MAG: Xaa-Pro peptidase family protein [Ilumatobacteraceae bacterium]
MTDGNAAQGTLTEDARAGASRADSFVEPIGIDMSARLAAIDQHRLNADRLAKFRAELVRNDYGAALLSDPINIRYATGARNMTLWTLHAPGRYVFVPVDGPVVMFEFGSTQHASDGLATINETRVSTPWFYFMTGPRRDEKARLWASQVVDLMREHGGADRRLAVDRCEPWGARHLLDAGLSLHDAQEPIEQARMLKTADEIACLQLSMDVCDLAVDRMRLALQPGITENQLWSKLHATNIAHDGEWIECRLLSSGPRTNPWFQESGNRVIQEGDIVGFDTDMVGPNGYLADISRTWVCPGKPATAEQRMLYDIAQEQVGTNVELLRPGLTLREFTERCWHVPDSYLANRYMTMVHGVGLVDEYPFVVFAVDYDDWGYDDVIQENMVLCVESYIGALDGQHGVKLEQQVLITHHGAVTMSRIPMIDALALP